MPQLPKIVSLAGKILLVLLSVALLAALSYWIIAVKKNAQSWLVLAIVSGLLCLLVAAIAIWQYRARRKEKQFINRIIDQDNARISLGKDSMRIELRELSSKWKESVERLRKSALRKKGNPLYVLPWYMVMGESGAGKTSAIRNSGLSTPMTELERIRGIDGTKNCDWYFLDNAIVLDTAGRYTIPDDEVADLEEWKSFLALLSRHRRREPISGLVLAISVERLLLDTEERTIENGKLIRQHINHLIRALGAKFPVYVMVTKMDLVYGFNDFSNNLKPEMLHEAMGFLNNGKKLSWKEVLDEAVQSIGNRLHEIRNQLVQKSGKVSALMLFPEEFTELSTKLEIFLESVFRDNPYQVTPLIRGLFFSSALQQGKVISSFLAATGTAVPEITEEEASSKGIYLRDFFARIITADRKLLLPLLEYNIWRRLTSNLLLSAWLLFMLLIGGLMGYSFTYNEEIITRYGSMYKNAPVSLHGNASGDLVLMEKIRQEIMILQYKNQGWHVPLPIGFGKRGFFEASLKKRYCSLFEKKFITAFDIALIDTINTSEIAISPENRGDVIGYLVLRILSLTNNSQNFNISGFIPLASQVVQFVYYPEVKPVFAEMYGRLYHSYLLWNTGEKNNPEIITKREELQRLLVSILQNDSDSSMEWLTSLRQLSDCDIRLNTFWRGISENTATETVILKGAYTETGRKRIQTFLANMNSALENNNTKELSGADLKLDLLKSREQVFQERWYRTQFYWSWQETLNKVKEGTTLFATHDLMRRESLDMVSRQNPYLLALDVSAREIIAYQDIKKRPQWVSPLLQIATIRRIATEFEKLKSQASSGSAAEGSNSIQNDVSALLQKKPGESADTLQQAQAWLDYIKDLKALPVASMSSKQIADAYAGCFTVYSNSDSAGDKQKSPFVKCHESVKVLLATMNITQEKSTEEELVTGLLTAPLQYILLYAGDETADYLQKTWQESVLAEASQFELSKITRKLFSEQSGTVWKFVNGAALPFLQNTPEGYTERVDFMGNRIRFSDQFIAFLNKGMLIPVETQPFYPVVLGTLPSRSNTGAKIHPVSVKLEVSNTDKPFVLNNFNYPMQGTLNWSPDTCGRTSLTITFREFALQKIYEGNLGFVRFLEDFSNGTHIFKAEEFPEKQPILDKNGITSIKVSYRITGEEKIMRIINSMPASLPETIVERMEE